MATEMLNRTYIQHTEIPMFSDLNNWRAGGIFKNETFAGGALFSVEAEPSLENNPIRQTMSSSITTGALLSFLNSGFYEMVAEAGEDIVNVFAKEKEKETVVLYYEMSIIDAITGAVIRTTSGESFLDDSQVSSMGTSSLLDIQKAWATRFDMLNIKNPIIITGLIKNIFTGKVTSFSQFVSAGTLGAVSSSFGTVASKAVISALGVSSFAAIAIVATVVGKFVDELFEMAIGLDNHFGFGGEIVGFGDNGEAQYGSLKSSRGVTQNFKDIIATALGIESLGDTFRDYDYSDDAMASALDDSANTKDADNPNWEPTETDTGWDDGLPTTGEVSDHYSSHDGGNDDGGYEHDDFGGMDFGGEDNE